MITARVYYEISVNKTKTNRQLAKEKTLDDNAMYCLRHKDMNLENFYYC